MGLAVPAPLALARFIDKCCHVNWNFLFYDFGCI